MHGLSRVALLNDSPKTSIGHALMLQAEETTKTAHYWDLVHGRGRVAYFLSTRSLLKIIKPILKQEGLEAAAQVLMEDAHAAALASVACGSALQQDHAPQYRHQRERVVKRSLPRSHTLLEFMCGSRPTHVRLLHDGVVSAYVGIDASQRALHLTREACKQQTSATAAGTAAPAVSASRIDAEEGGAAAAEETPSELQTSVAPCIHEALGCCMLLRHDCRLLSDALPLLQSRFILLVAGLDDIIARSTTDNTDAQGPCDEALLQVLHSAAYALPIGGILLLIEPTKHAPELLLSLYKALQHPVLACRFLLCEGAELVGPSNDVLLLRLRRHTDAAECMQALEHFHTNNIVKMAAKKPFRSCLSDALEAPQSVQQAMPLLHRLSLIQQADELAFLLLQASKEGDLLAATKLLALGADVNHGSTGSESPLHAAIAAGAPQLVDLLFRHGAEAMEGPSGCPLLHAAELLLQEAVSAGFKLPQELECKAGTSWSAAVPGNQQLPSAIRVLSWVEGEMARLMTGGKPCGVSSQGDDFLQKAAGIHPIRGLIWPFGDPLEEQIGPPV
ncbi:uncharacterized protein LOC34617937 [Cyclospora cayetanensis]|uniref:Uncharacterized protein LOC34617937 n=1 Tax=Cyclospora cayetanensis TaxID=88456 RepID=A0A6P6RXL6_9EIME|nr:uncharacterized protein LOC34617937 [Cyclospora cayetanensis]